MNTLGWILTGLALWLIIGLFLGPSISRRLRHQTEDFTQ